MQQHWVRFEQAGKTGFGTLSGGGIEEHRGDMFGALDADRPRAGARRRASCSRRREPTKVIALWNNFHALGDKLGLAVPAEPLYLLKAPNSLAGARRRRSASRAATARWCSRASWAS